ncbi:MAG: hypothetical protein GY940_41510 [bacterium]|nr:hypothetical protein [bacterium]
MKNFPNPDSFLLNFRNNHVYYSYIITTMNRKPNNDKMPDFYSLLNATIPDHCRLSVKPFQVIIREGLETLLTVMLEKEITAFIGMHSHRVSSDGLKQIVRNGFHKERTIACGMGDIRISVPRSRDRRSGVTDKLVFQSRIIPRYMRRVAELDSYVPYLYYKGLLNGDFSQLLALLLGEEEGSGLSEPLEFPAPTRYRAPKWNRPEGFNPSLPVDWRRYWKWKESSILPTVLKRKRKWWIRWGKPDQLSGRVDVNRFTRAKRNINSHGFKPKQTVQSGRPVTSNRSKDISHVSAVTMIKQTKLNNHGFQGGSAVPGKSGGQPEKSHFQKISNR